MRMRTSALALCLAALATCGVVSLQAATTVPVSWDLGQITTHLDLDESGGVVADLPGSYRLSRPGAPDLPWIPVTVSIEPGKGVGSFTWTPGEEVLIGASMRPAAAPRPRPGSEGGPIAEPADPAVYEGTAPFPAELCRFAGLQARQGELEAIFHVSPFRWDPVSGDLTAFRGGRLSVELSEDGLRRPQPQSLRQQREDVIAAPDRGDRDRLERDADGRVLYSLSGGLQIGEVPTLEGLPVEFLVVTTDAMAPGFQDLVDWKNRNGEPAAIRTVEWIYENYPDGADNGERIRNFLRDAHRYWDTRIAILGGDPDVVPIRYAQDWLWGRPDGLSIATDYYYACLDGTWNADGDARYGEPVVPTLNETSDQVDFRPELQIGRIPANDLAQVELYMAKYMAYVTNPPLGDYLRNVITLGEVLFEPNWEPGDCDVCENCPDDTPCANRDGAEDCWELVEALGASEAGADFFEFTKLTERDYWWVERGHPDAQNLNIGSAIAAMNEGAAVVFHSGHGDRDRWAIGRDRVTTANLLGLDNGPNYSGMVYAINCNSAAVDYDCNGEAWLFAPNGGGLVYIGATNLDFPASARVLQNAFFSHWPGDGTVLPGEAYYAAMDSVAASIGDTPGQLRFLMYSLIFLGDPGMPVWTSVPSNMQVNGVTDLTVGEQDVQVIVLSGQSQGLSGARVTLYKEGDALASGLTNAVGFVSLPFAPTSPGEVHVTVTHPDGIPHRSTVTVTPRTGGGFLALESFSINDVTDGEVGTRGNGNGVLEFGEIVGLDLAYANHGDASLLDPTATLSENDVPADLDFEIVDGEATLPSVGGGATGSMSNAFLIRIGAEESDGGEELPGRRTLHLDLEWQDTETHAETISPNVYRPSFGLYRTTVEEVVGNGDGDFDASEQFRLSFEVLNRGPGTASGITATLTADNPSGITVTTGFSNIDEFASFEVGSTEFFEIGINQPNPVNHGLTLTLEDGRTFPRVPLWASAIEIGVPGAPTDLSGQGFPDRVALQWANPEDDDIAGYRVYRATSAEGPFEPAGVGFVPRTSAVADSGYYSDEGLPSLSQFYYQVATIDASGNESERTEVLAVSTAPGQVSGWPALLGEANGNAPTIEQLDFGDFEIVFATDVVYAFSAHAEDYYDGDETPSTRGRLTRAEDGYRYLSKPAVADLDGDGEMEIVAAYWLADDGVPPPPREVNLVVYDRLGNVLWNHLLTSSAVLSSPVIGQLDTDPELEIAILANRSVFAFNHDGSAVGSAPALRTLPDDRAWFLYGSVALAEMDASSVGQEIAFVTRALDENAPAYFYAIRANGSDLPGFPFSFSDAGSTADGSNSSPAVADVDGDGHAEVVVASRKRLWMFNTDPADDDPSAGWSRDIGRYPSIELNSSPALGDIDRDGSLEVVLGGPNGRLYVLDAASGDPLPQFTESPEDGYLQIAGMSAKMGSPILGDLTGDGNPEIILGDATGLVYVYEHTGQPVSGFPYVMGGEVLAGLALWDTDKDGHPSLIIQADQIQSVVALDFPNVTFDHGEPDLMAYPWTQFRHDPRNTGDLTVVPLPIFLAAPQLTSAGGLDVQLSWIAEVGFDTFFVYRRPVDGKEWQRVGSYPAPDVRTEEGEYRVVDRVPAEGEWVYQIGGLELDGSETLSPEGTITVSGAPQAFRLHPARPNPFRPFTAVRLDLPEETQAAVHVYDASGRVVRTLLDGVVAGGTHNLVWDGRDDQGHELGSGIYFIRAQGDGRDHGSQKIVHVK